VVDARLDVEELDKTGIDDEELVEGTKEEVEVSTLVELSEFDVGSEEEDENEELPTAVWLVVKDVLEK